MRSAFLRTPAVRQLTARRFASSTTTSEASAKTQDVAKKAQDVAKTAVDKLSTAASGLGMSLLKVGGRTGRLIHRANAMRPTVNYYSRVGLELSKLVYRGQQMAPPKLETVKQTFSPLLALWHAPSATIATLSTSVAASSRTLAAGARNISRTQLAQSGVIAAEIVGFFTIGEIIGRRKLVGYRGEQH